MSKKITNQLIKAIKAENCDYEFYPTTNEIILAFCENLNSYGLINNRKSFVGSLSVLEVGAGDSRVLRAMREYQFDILGNEKHKPQKGKFFGKQYAIEKSVPLIQAMDSSVILVGSDFFAQDLTTKEVSIIFSNPPYKMHSKWCEKLIKEANAKVAYLVIPQRWKRDKSILDAIELRKAEVEVIGQFNFLSADRAARANVELIRISFVSETGTNCYNVNCNKTTDPFNVWFSEHFTFGNGETSEDGKNQRKSSKQIFKEKLDNAIVTVESESLTETLVRLYDSELDNLLTTFQTLANVDKRLLKELNVNVDNVREALKLKINNLKNLYWNEIFECFEPIKSRLTSAVREQMRTTILNAGTVDFSLENITAIVTWIVKCSNSMFDKQLIILYERLARKANAISYKSNKKVYKDCDWRYTKPDAKFNLEDRFKLDYRIIMPFTNALSSDRFNSKCGLNEVCHDFIADLTLIAKQLGFDVSTTIASDDISRNWNQNPKQEFEYFNHSKDQNDLLMDAKAHINGNLHVRFNQRFICNLNCEYGRLKGWLRSPQEAAKELEIPEAEAVAFFGTSLQILPSHILLKLGLTDSDKEKIKEEDFNLDDIDIDIDDLNLNVA